MLKFSASKQDLTTIAQIADRAVNVARKRDIDYPYLDALMDINAVHSNGCPLRLAELLTADDFNFSHDVFGILRHINRKTGKLENGFTPRFSQAQ